MQAASQADPAQRVYPLGCGGAGGQSVETVDWVDWHRSPHFQRRAAEV